MILVLVNRFKVLLWANYWFCWNFC